ncbi:MAG: hypothetical protein ACRDSH_00130 [Pseudonocardiaceae bacterium]
MSGYSEVMAGSDVRLCFVGDSYTLGVGDPTGAGWVGPVAAAAREQGHQVTFYNLGVRRDTSSRSAIAGSLRHAAGYRSTDIGAVRADAHNAGWAALAIGPPPVADLAATERARVSCAGMARVCRGRDVPFLDVGADLSTDPVWVQEVAASDGSHPSTPGYQRFARHVEPALLQWLSGF